jgi:hypothetical protein
MPRPVDDGDDDEDSGVESLPRHILCSPWAVICFLNGGYSPSADGVKWPSSSSGKQSGA